MDGGIFKNREKRKRQQTKNKKKTGDEIVNRGILLENRDGKNNKRC